MTPKTDGEILTYYILSQGMDPENDEIRKVCEETHGYKFYHFATRTEELKTALSDVMKKIINNYLDNTRNRI